MTLKLEIPEDAVQIDVVEYLDAPLSRSAFDLYQHAIESHYAEVIPIDSAVISQINADNHTLYVAGYILDYHVNNCRTNVRTAHLFSLGCVDFGTWLKIAMNITHDYEGGKKALATAGLLGAHPDCIITQPARVWRVGEYDLIIAHEDEGHHFSTRIGVVDV